MCIETLAELHNHTNIKKNACTSGECLLKKICIYKIIVTSCVQNGKKWNKKKFMFTYLVTTKTKCNNIYSGMLPSMDSLSFKWFINFNEQPLTFYKIKKASLFTHLIKTIFFPCTVLNVQFQIQTKKKNRDIY